MNAPPEAGDIIQITDENHAWYPALLVVTDPQSWGVQACCLMPQNNVTPASCTRAYIRLETGKFARVGVADVIPS